MSQLPFLVAVVGPTASGKTALGAALAGRFGGEIVSADAKQVFRGMDIGTAKEVSLPIPQHLIDIKNPGERITVAEYQALAYEVIDELLNAGKLPLLVGGSMLYAEAVLNGYVFSDHTQQPRYAALKLALAVDRTVLWERIAARTQAWVEEGILEEIEHLLAAGVSATWLRWCGQEYRYFTEYLQGEISLAAAIEQTNQSIRAYVKRQYTWWRRHPDLHWVESEAEAVRLVEQRNAPNA